MLGESLRYWGFSAVSTVTGNCGCRKPIGNFSRIRFTKNPERHFWAIMSKSNARRGHIDE
ncbi:hypothetical protein M595_3293 [Lyngbya aestuarii BL J]|uniref:Uncharacterized protein n=1 Tax=Lyngbya aestuarii BL J TaxID=1348334 RepID=U7QFL8_9CYAN|nr:hypothetical protein M595_3293 [Lyngbya aestuarii BL J]